MPSQRAKEIFVQGFSQLGRKYASSKRKAKENQPATDSPTAAPAKTKTDSI